MKLTTKKSQEQANFIKCIAAYISFLDPEYLRQCAKEMIEQASLQESMAVLNPLHIQEKNDLIRAQGNALKHMCDYIDSLKEIDEIKNNIKIIEKNRSDINSMFL